MLFAVGCRQFLLGLPTAPKYEIAFDVWRLRGDDFNWEIGDGRALGIMVVGSWRIGTDDGPSAQQKALPKLPKMLFDPSVVKVSGEKFK